MTMKLLDPSTFRNPRMKEVAYSAQPHRSRRPALGTDRVWARGRVELHQVRAYKHAEALLFEHARRLRGINAGGNRGERDSVSDDQSSSGEGNRRSEGKCASCSRDLNLDQANPESAETAVSVGREGL